MVQPLSYLKETASQTAGPYVHIGLAPGAAGFKIFDQELGHDIAGPNAEGERITVEGVVIDGTGAPLKDVLIEIWQANAAGVYPHPADKRSGAVEEGFRGWGRVISDFATGLWSFETVKPGRIAGRSGHHRMAPHINVWIVSRGINLGLATRLYFGDEAAANAEDPVLRIIEQPERRKTLIASQVLREGRPVYTFDIRLQGECETVFFDV